MAKKPSDKFDPPEVKDVRQYIDDNFPISYTYAHPVGQTKEEYFDNYIINEKLFPHCWAIIYYWMLNPNNAKINKSHAEDIIRLNKIEQEAKTREISPSLRDNAWLEYVKYEKERTKYYPPLTKQNPTPCIRNGREVADGDLAHVTAKQLYSLRSSFIKWTQGPRAAILETELPKDKERLKKIEQEGRRRNLPSFTRKIN